LIHKGKQGAKFRTSLQTGDFEGKFAEVLNDISNSPHATLFDTACNNLTLSSSAAIFASPNAAARRFPPRQSGFLASVNSINCAKVYTHFPMMSSWVSGSVQ